MSMSWSIVMTSLSAVPSAAAEPCQLEPISATKLTSASGSQPLFWEHEMMFETGETVVNCNEASLA